MAIQNSPGQKASLGAIYDWIQDAFPYFAGIDKTGWQNSVRHNLSLHKFFYRTENQSARKGGGIWRIDTKHAIGNNLITLLEIFAHYPGLFSQEPLEKLPKPHKSPNQSKPTSHFGNPTMTPTLTRYHPKLFLCLNL